MEPNFTTDPAHRRAPKMEGLLICLTVLFIYLVLHYFYSTDRMERDKHDLTLLSEQVTKLQGELQRATGTTQRT